MFLISEPENFSVANIDAVASNEYDGTGLRKIDVIQWLKGGFKKGRRALQYSFGHASGSIGNAWARLHYLLAKRRAAREEKEKQREEESRFRRSLLSMSFSSTKEHDSSGEPAHNILNFVERYPKGVQAAALSAALALGGAYLVRDKDMHAWKDVAYLNGKTPVEMAHVGDGVITRCINSLGAAGFFSQKAARDGSGQLPEARMSRELSASRSLGELYMTPVYEPIDLDVHHDKAAANDDKFEKPYSGSGTGAINLNRAAINDEVWEELHNDAA